MCCKLDLVFTVYGTFLVRRAKKSRICNLIGEDGSLMLFLELFLQVQVLRYCSAAARGLRKGCQL